ncbi:hypothetical protein PoB_006029700 [Plakobranchus ocellatus]|uniref:Uncharacterized protein n=1 Tax=Plakobranchus ocellatus TaxID=259542 RepID=A0AAV4CPJ2_9GAST|nr:hypothetical protein PoB_006029700 [Plakobranchus ocellatus]
MIGYDFNRRDRSTTKWKQRNCRLVWLRRMLGVASGSSQSVLRIKSRDGSAHEIAVTQRSGLLSAWKEAQIYINGTREGFIRLVFEWTIPTISNMTSVIANAVQI